MTFHRVPFSTVAARNLIINPSFETNTSYGWEAETLAPLIGVQARPGGVDATYGARALVWNTGGGSGTSGVRTALTTPSISFGLSPTVYYRFQIRKQLASQPGNTVEARLSFYDGSGTLLGSPSWVAASGTISDTAWLNVAGSVTAAAGAVSFRLGVRVPSANGSGGFLLDGVIVSLQNVTYFDGDTAPVYGSMIVSDDRYSYWMASPHLSEAVQTGSTTDDRLDADLDAVLPFDSSRQVRTVVGRLLDSSSTRSTFIPAGPRTGTYKAVFTDPDDATAAQEWFANASHIYFRDATTTHANMLFTVAEGGVDLTQRADVGTELVIPFVERVT